MFLYVSLAIIPVSSAFMAAFLTNTPFSKNVSISFLASVLNFFIAAPSSPTMRARCAARSSAIQFFRAAPAENCVARPPSLMSQFPLGNVLADFKEGDPATLVQFLVQLLLHFVVNIFCFTVSSENVYICQFSRSNFK